MPAGSPFTAAWRVARISSCCPEIPFDYQKVVDAVNKRTEEGCLSTMIVVAEGALPEGWLHPHHGDHLR